MRTIPKQLLSIIFSFLNIIAFGQNLNFEEITSNSLTHYANLTGLTNSSNLFIDIDNDLDLDLLMVGDKNDDISIHEPIATLYINNGNGNFSEVPNTPFIGVENGSTACSDIDNDNDLDIIITGTNSNGNAITKLYTNDGTGNFIEVTITTIVNLTYSAVEFSDIDNDLDEDLFLTGQNDSGVKFSKLYLNDGNGNFIESIDSTFFPISKGDIIFADLNNDGIDDLLLCGQINNQSIGGFIVSGITKFYLNDGFGTFTEDTISVFSDFEICSVDVGDVDNDNDLDIIISGLVGSNNQTELYINNGNALFTLDPSVQLYGCFDGDIAFLDMDNDLDLDIVLTGKNDGSEHSRIYTNDGNGNFIEESSVEITGLGSSSLAIGDIDNDNDIDILFSGYFNIGFGNTNASYMYSNDGLGNYSKILNFYLVGGRDASSFADIDGDNDLDLLILGHSTLESTERTGLYINDGMGNYTEVIDVPFENLRHGEVIFADIDNDDDLDLLISGQTISNNARTKLYLNNGTGTFTESGSNFTGLTYSYSKFADIDNDNDLDLLMIGAGGSWNDLSLTLLYKNDGLGNFTLITNTNLPNVHNGGIAFSDVDNDNDLDVIISGDVSTLTTTNITKLYLNDGFGNFTLSTAFSGVRDGSIAFADIDNDNDEDFILTGYSNLGDISKLYKNDGLGNFTEVMNTGIAPSDKSALFIDLDKDNDVDLLLTGTSDFAKIYTNDGVGNFSYYPTDLFEGLNRYICVGDFDNDTDIDLLLHGTTNTVYTSKLFRNTNCNNPTTYINVTVPSICDTDSTLIFIDPIYQSYLWSNGDTTNSIYVSDTNNYSVLLTTNNYCQIPSNTISINSFDCTIFIDSLHQVVNDCLLDTASIVMAFVNNIVFLNDSINVTWNFVTESGNTLFATASYFLEENGVYSISIELNCNGKKTPGSIFYDLILLEYLGEKEHILGHLEFVIYPNPASNYLKVDLYKSYKKISIQIFSLDGKIVRESLFENSNRFIVNVADFDPSIYLIKTIADGIELPIAKFMKQ